MKTSEQTAKRRLTPLDYEEAFTLRIDTSNAAFDGEDKAHEVARILRQIAAKISTGETGGTVRDINGNTVGEWKL